MLTIDTYSLVNLFETERIQHANKMEVDGEQQWRETQLIDQHLQLTSRVETQYKRQKPSQVRTTMGNQLSDA